MLNSEHQLRIKELRGKISKKPQIVDKIQAIENIGQKYKVDVLLVDDDISGNLVYTKYLEGLNNVNNIVSMTCPIQSFEYLQGLNDNKKNFPKVILLDINMPLMSGSEFLAKFKESFPKKKTKIILFTLYTKDQIKEELKNNRVIGHLSKPLNIDKLETIIKKNFS